MAAIIIIWIINLAISFWNAYAVGSTWVEGKHHGGWRRFTIWCGAIMTDVGFTWCILILLGWLANSKGILNDYSFELLMNAGYVLIIPFVLIAGWAITFDGWARNYRREQRTMASMAATGYNTFAMSYNTYNAVRTLPDAIGKLFEGLFGGKRRKGKDDAQAMLILLILIFSIGLGTMLTYWLINRYAANDEPMPTRHRLERTA